MFDGVKQTAAVTARRAGFISVGGGMFLVGAGFLTVAGWIYLAAVLNPLQAATIIGLIYVGIGLILMGFGLRSRSHFAPPAPEKTVNNPPMMQAFLYGLQAGASADRRKG